MRAPTSAALVTTALLVSPWIAAAQVSITVCASGCDHANLQTAIDAAQPGDTLLLRAGETFTGNFRLPVKGTSTSYITIRSDANDANLPPAGRRITPSSAAYLPKIRSGNPASALTLDLGAHHYRLMFLELQANDRGFGEILQLGLNEASQNHLSLVPHHLILDRVYIHGHPFQGQKRCVALNSASTTIVNSYISDCKGIGQETQAIGGMNGPGPYTIENNYLEGSGVNVIFGGADPIIPDLVPSDITFRYNYLSKPLAWRDPILATPQAQASAAATGGSLAAGTYFYRVQARAANGYQDITYQSDGSAEVSATVASGSTGSVTISWAAVPSATEYRIHGRAAGAPATYWTVTGTSFTDNGGGGTAMTGSIGEASKWLVKNAFELKNARNVTVSGNIIERSWIHSQTGFLVVLTPRNQDGNCPWCIVDNVEMSYNIIRQGAQGVQILGEDDHLPSQRTRTLSIHNNLFYDIGRGLESDALKLFQIGHVPESLVIDHNTADLRSGSQIYIYGPLDFSSLTVTNNLLQMADYGVFGDGPSAGTPTLNTYATSWTFRKNTVAGAPAASYPADNFFPTLAQWQGEFVDYANDDFHLEPGSPYRGAGTDGKDLGVDLAGLEAATAGVLTGDRTAGGGGIGPWQSDDIGAVGTAGGATLSGSTFTLEAGGTALWDTSDAFHYVYRPLTGDGEIVARVAGLTVPAGANSTLGGVMIREQLTAGSIHASMIITTQGKAKFRRRGAVGGITLSDGPTTSTTYPPRWLKLARAGDDFTAALSDDGVTWTQVHTTQTVPMAETVYIGLMALRDGAGAPACTATFDNVSVRHLPSPWQNADVGPVGAAGGASHSGGVFTIEAGGTVLFDTSDAFHYVYQPLNGDGEIVVNLTGLTVPAGAESALAAVMIREKLTESSVHASMMITTAGKAKFRRRMTEGGATLSDGPTIGTLYPPRWLRLTRAGNTFTASMSSDGSSWTQVHIPVTVAMPANVHIGFMALRSGGTGTTTATVRDVSVVP